MITIIYDLIMDELNSRNVYKYDVYAPYYIASIATHWFNLYNLKHNIYFEAKEIPSLRAHILFVAPPGSSKSFYLEQFLDGKNAILKDTGLLVGMEQEMSAAGFVGTVSEGNGFGNHIEYGIAYEYRTGILGVDEFAGITDAFNTTHSLQLKNQLLSALDRGWVRKRLAKGKLEYRTQVTLWTGTQPERIDVSSGLGRRFIFLLFIPSREDKEKMFESWWRSKSSRLVSSDLVKLREKIARFPETLKLIKSVSFDDDVFRFYVKNDLEPYEGSYMDRIIIGYHLAKYGAEEHVVIGMESNEMREFLKREIDWRKKTGFGADLLVVMSVLKSDGGSDRTLSMEYLYYRLNRLGMSPDKIIDVLRRLSKMKFVKVSGEYVTLIKDIGEVNFDVRRR